MNITQYLINNHGFFKTNGYDFDQYTCVSKIHDITYLFYSENLKHFTIAVKNKIKPRLKDSQRVPNQFRNKVMIPRVIDSVEVAANLVNWMKGNTLNNE